MLIYWLHMLAEKFDIMCLLILGFCRRTDKFGCLGLQPNVSASLICKPMQPKYQQAYAPILMSKPSQTSNLSASLRYPTYQQGYATKVSASARNQSISKPTLTKVSAGIRHQTYQPAYATKVSASIQNHTYEQAYATKLLSKPMQPNLSASLRSQSVSKHTDQSYQ